MKNTDNDYRAKYYELRRTAKELIFENSAYQNEITECQQKIRQREVERELLLQHLLQYEQEEWELQRELNNASHEKHRATKRNNEADKRKRVRLEAQMAEAAAAAHTAPPDLSTDPSLPKIPKIKIVFQQKGPGMGPSQTEPITKHQGPVIDMNSEAKAAIKNKIKRNKIDPIVISLPTSVSNKDPLSGAPAPKRSRPNHLGLNLSSLLPGAMAAAHQNMMLSPSLLSAAVSSSNQGMRFPSDQIAELLAHNAAAQAQVQAQVAALSGERTPDVFTPESSTPSTPSLDDRLLTEGLRAQFLGGLGHDTDPVSMLNAMKRSSSEIPGTSSSVGSGSSGFRISSSALRSIKQKIDSINANFDQAAMIKAAVAKAITSPTLTQPHENLGYRKEPAEKG